MALLYPEKAAYVGDDGLEPLINEAYETAGAYGFSTVKGYTMTALAMLVFGHGCFADPFYPGISKIFEDERIADVAQRSEWLKDNLIDWLDRLISQIDERYQA